MTDTDASPQPPTDLMIRPMTVSDAELIARMLDDQPAEYLRFFYAVGNSVDDIRSILSRRRRDVYSGIFWSDELICLFTLRGWDDGFDVPSFGLVVRVGHRGREIVTAALEVAKVITRLAGGSQIMCKVHPDNVAATKAALRLGFQPGRTEDGSGNIIYRINIGG